MRYRDDFMPRIYRRRFRLRYTIQYLFLVLTREIRETPSHPRCWSFSKKSKQHRSPFLFTHCHRLWAVPQFSPHMWGTTVAEGEKMRFYLSKSKDPRKVAFNEWQGTVSIGNHDTIYKGNVSIKTKEPGLLYLLLRVRTIDVEDRFQRRRKNNGGLDEWHQSRLRAAIIIRNAPFIFSELVKNLHEMDGRFWVSDTFDRRSTSSTSANARDSFRLQ